MCGRGSDAPKHAIGFLDLEEGVLEEFCVTNIEIAQGENLELAN